MRWGATALRNVRADTIAACQDAGLCYWQHVIALLATIRHGDLIPRPSFWQRIHTRRALDRGQQTHLVCHEDVLVFRKPDRPDAATQAAYRADRPAEAVAA